MQFDPNNRVVQLCAEGMSKEGEGQPEEAKRLFEQAWSISANDFEKFTAAHYVARHQNTVQAKLDWDQRALELAKKLTDVPLEGAFPSLYLNIAKGYEDLNDRENAIIHYELAFSYTHFLADDGYGKMIKKGIEEGLKRVSG